MGEDHRNCPFCMIVSGRRPAEVILRVDGFSVFRPIGRSLGKVLVVPNEHHETLDSMPEQLRDAWLRAAERVVTHLGAVSYRFQISVGSEHQQVRHLYAQLTYQEAPCRAASS